MVDKKTMFQAAKALDEVLIETAATVLIGSDGLPRQADRGHHGESFGYNPIPGSTPLLSLATLVGLSLN